MPQQDIRSAGRSFELVPNEYAPQRRNQRVRRANGVCQGDPRLKWLR
jgi:hypothetical protein